MNAEPLAPPGASPVRAIGIAAAGLAAIATLGQAFVVLREVYVASEAGTSASIDALLVALVMPSIAVSLLSSSTQAALVPAIIDVQSRAGGDAGKRLVGTILLGIITVGVLFVVLIGLFAEASVAIAGPGLAPASRATAVSFVPILLPLIVLAPASAILAGTCQAHGLFRSISASWVAGPVVALLVTVVLWSRYGVGALALATTADAAATLVALAFGLARAGVLPRPGLRAERADLSRFTRHAAPLTAGSFVLQLNLLTDRAVASLLSTGAVSALRYGERIVRVPISVFLPAWSTAVYPAIARSGADADPTAMGRTASEALRYVIATFTPIAVATAALAPLIVSFAYQRGAFDEAATVTTAGVVACFAPLILLWLVQPILSSAHNARRRGTLLAGIALLNAFLNVVLNVAFGFWLGVAGVALSTSLTGWILTGVLARRLRDLEPEFALRPVARVAAQSLLASLIPAIPVAVLTWHIRPALDVPGQFLLLLAATLAGAAVYLGLARVLGLREPWVAVAAVTRMARAGLGRRA